METSKNVHTGICIHCGKPGFLEVDAASYNRWQEGEFVQNAFPDMPLDDREQLISGIHGKCFDEMFPPDE